MRLDDLGPRICVMGPSNAGKSTLTLAISRAKGLPAVHVDQLYHLPDTDWQPRPREEFNALHDEAILGERWVMDGNYDRVMPQRLARATGLIVLDVSTLTSLARYFPRTLFQTDRAGNLDGARDSVKWAMIHHITVYDRKKRKSRREFLKGFSLPTIDLKGPRAINRFYQTEGLSR